MANLDDYTQTAQFKENATVKQWTELLKQGGYKNALKNNAYAVFNYLQDNGSIIAMERFPDHEVEGTTKELNDLNVFCDALKIFKCDREDQKQELDGDEIATNVHHFVDRIVAHALAYVNDSIKTLEATLQGKKTLPEIKDEPIDLTTPRWGNDAPATWQLVPDAPRKQRDTTNPTKRALKFYDMLDAGAANTRPVMKFKMPGSASNGSANPGLGGRSTVPGTVDPVVAKKLAEDVTRQVGATLSTMFDDFETRIKHSLEEKMDSLSEMAERHRDNKAPPRRNDNYDGIGYNEGYDKHGEIQPDNHVPEADHRDRTFGNIDNDGDRRGRNYGNGYSAYERDGAAYRGYDGDRDLRDNTRNTGNAGYDDGNTQSVQLISVTDNNPPAELPTTIFKCKPPIFPKLATGGNLDGHFAQLERYFRLSQVPVFAQIDFALLSIPQYADWWDSYYMTRDTSIPVTWDMFKDTMKSFIMGQSPAQTAMSRLLNLKQGTFSTEKYAKMFLNLVRQSNTMPTENWLVHHFLMNLTDVPMRRLLTANKGIAWTNLTTLIQHMSDMLSYEVKNISDGQRAMNVFKPSAPLRQSFNKFTPNKAVFNPNHSDRKARFGNKFNGNRAGSKGGQVRPRGEDRRSGPPAPKPQFNAAVRKNFGNDKFCKLCHDTNKPPQVYKSHNVANCTYKEAYFAADGQRDMKRPRA